MRTARQMANALDDFANRHGYTVTNALMVYSGQMRKDADMIQAQYDKIKNNEKTRERQDQTVVTMNGLLYTMQACRESAARADAARDAWESLTETLEDDYENEEF